MIYAEENTRTKARTPYESPLFEVLDYDDCIMDGFGGSAPDEPIIDPGRPMGAKYSSFGYYDEEEEYDECETFGPKNYDIWDE